MSVFEDLDALSEEEWDKVQTPNLSISCSGTSLQLHHSAGRSTVKEICICSERRYQHSMQIWMVECS